MTAVRGPLRGSFLTLSAASALFMSSPRWAWGLFLISTLRAVSSSPARPRLKKMS